MEQDNVAIGVMGENATLSLIITAKNESVTIRDIITTAKPYVDEVLVVDGHSTDDTREVSERLGARVVLDHGKGKGDGVRVGIKEATGDILVFIDADGSHDPHDIPKLTAPLLKDEYDMVIGSRMTGGSDELTGARQAGMTPVLIRAIHENSNDLYFPRENWDGPSITSLAEVFDYL